MGHHFLLVEGVNLYANIYDTDQLSVIRGSSFLYIMKKTLLGHIMSHYGLFIFASLFYFLQICDKI